MLAWLSVRSEVQTCLWPSWCHCHSLSLASVKSILVLPFWYWLTCLVTDKGPLNVCVCVCVYRSTCVSQHLQLRTGGFCSCKVLLPACPCWRQPAHLDQAEEMESSSTVLSYTVSIPLISTSNYSYICNHPESFHLHSCYKSCIISVKQTVEISCCLFCASEMSKHHVLYLPILSVWTISNVTIVLLASATDTRQYHNHTKMKWSNQNTSNTSTPRDQ